MVSLVEAAAALQAAAALVTAGLELRSWRAARRKERGQGARKRGARRKRH